jgi:hypothetical protein
MKFFKKNQKQQDNFLLYIPIKNHNNWMQKENVVYLVFKHDRLIERFAAWLTKKPTVRDIRLDKLGTRVWQLIDGTRSVYAIGQMLQQEYGQDCDPVYQRLIVYLRYLSNRGWIKFQLKNVKEPSLAKL